MRQFSGGRVFVTLTLPALLWASSCTCDCCLAEVSDTIAQCHEVRNNDDRFMSKFLAVRTCEETCAPPVDDPYLETALAEIDYERFCTYECKPVKFEVGALCKSGGHRDKSGNGAAMQLVHQATLHRSNRVAGTPESWPTAPLEAHSAAKNTEDLNELAEATRDVAVNHSKFNEELATKLEKRKAVLVATAGKSGQYADTAQKWLDAGLTMEEKIYETASDAAASVYKETMDDLRNSTLMEAKAENMKAAEELVKKMKAEIPEAREKAKAPYEAAAKHQGELMKSYVTAADNLMASSINTQMGATQFLGAANMLNAVGDTAKAQKKMQVANMMIEDAKSMAKTAQGYYDTAAGLLPGIAGGPGSYPAEAEQAAYHAEVMLNPDAYPPQTPLV